MKLSDVTGDPPPSDDAAPKKTKLSDVQKPAEGGLSLGAALKPLADIPREIGREFNEGAKTSGDAMRALPKDVMAGKPLAALGDVGKYAGGVVQSAISPYSGAQSALLNKPLEKTVPQDTGWGKMTTRTIEDIAGVFGPAPAMKFAQTFGSAAVKTLGEAAATAGKSLGVSASEIIGTLGTHTGGEAIRQAVLSGFAGGQKSEAFLDAMRGNAPMEDVIGSAKEALSSMRAARSAEYKAGMGAVKDDATVLKFDDVDKALDRMSDVGMYKGKAINPNTDTFNQVKQSVEEWKTANPAEFHTAEGLDALKQRLGSIREGTMPGTRDRVIVDQAYNAVKDTIVKQAPTYAKTMADYEKASTELRELERAFSLGEKASQDTALRKLQSVMRNNVSTNYGNRMKLAKLLEDHGAATLMPRLAGHAMSSVAPRGLGGAVAGATGIGSTMHPALAATLPFQSPRLVGEAAHALGAGARKVKDVLGDLGVGQRP